MTDFVDPYAYPGSAVLINRPGLRDAAQLRQFEYEATAARLQEIEQAPIPGKFDLDHLKKIHGHIFRDVYEWAGKARTVGISKGATIFAWPSHIESYGEKITAGLAKEGFLKGLDKDHFVKRIAHYYTELNALHPFREGNGRATRVFIGQLAREAGYTLDQERIDNDKGRWNEAAARSFAGDLRGIEAFFSLAIRPTRAIAFEQLGEREALSRHPELKGTFDALQALDRTLQERLPNNQQARDKYLLEARAEAVKRLDRGVIVSSLERSSPTVEQQAGPARDR